MKRFLSALLCAVLMLGLLPSVSPPAGMITAALVTVDKTSAFVGEPFSWLVSGENGTGPYDYVHGLFKNSALINNDLFAPDSVNPGSYTPAEPGTYMLRVSIMDMSDHTVFYVDSQTIAVSLRPAPVIAKVETASATSLKITWNAIPGADGYEVWRSAGTSGDFSFLTNATGASLTDTGLTPVTPYFYKVRAYNVISSANVPSSGFSAVSSGAPGYPAPAITSVESLSATSLKVTWSKVAGAAGYEVWRGTGKTEPFTRIKTTTALSFTNTYLTAGTRYGYRIRAYNVIEGVIVPTSALCPVKSGVPLAKPTIVSATGVSSSGIKLTWTKVTGATGYQIFRSTSATGTYKSIKLTTALTFTAGGMLHAKTYYFKVRPYKKILTAIYYGPLSGYKAGKTK